MLILTIPVWCSVPESPGVWAFYMNILIIGWVVCGLAFIGFEDFVAGLIFPLLIRL